MNNVNLSDDGTICGYGSVFGVLDSHRDIVEKGAYTDTLKQWAKKGRLPAMLLMHSMGPLISDQLPIGIWRAMYEDDIGLWCEGKLALDNSVARDVYALLRTSPPAIDGLSIGFVPLKFEVPRNSDVKRRLTQIKLLEVSIVTSPSNPESVISRVKTRPEPADRVTRALAKLAESLR
jgi:HK97 family phage prohead protease